MNLILLLLAIIGNIGWIATLFRQDSADLDEVERLTTENERLRSRVSLLQWEARARAGRIDELEAERNLLAMAAQFTRNIGSDGKPLFLFWMN